MWDWVTTSCLVNPPLVDSTIAISKYYYYYHKYYYNYITIIIIIIYNNIYENIISE